MDQKMEDEEVSIKPVREDELPPEFKKFDKPLGLEQHVFNILTIAIFGHGFGLYTLFYLMPAGYVPFTAYLFLQFYCYVTGMGTTVGSHRYWTHRTFKAKLPLQISLMLMQTAGFQMPIFKWCRDHRVHHKYTDTIADPHNAARGFWFSHIGWLFLPKHPDVEKSLKIVDISDLARDPVVRFQSKYYWQLLIVFSFILPMSIWKYFWPEMSWFTVFSLNWFRHIFSLHFTFLVNSAAHMWGDKPYDKYISSAENSVVSFLAMGEGWHNYHHTFPWDYKTGELGHKMNLSTQIIDIFAKFGWIYDMKTVSHKLLVDRINRTGDGSHALHSKDTLANNNCKGDKAQDNDDLSYSHCWGWGDERLTKEDLKLAEVMFPSKAK